MMNKINIIVATAFIAGTMLIGWNASAQSLKNAHENAITSMNNISEANDTNRSIQISNDRFQKFKKESEDRISNYEKNIAELKQKIKDEKNEGKTKYQKLVADLEQKTADLKKNLNEYKEEGNHKWKSFKIKFNHNMDELGKSISNFFSNDNKK
jgi:hypothetical protein